MLGVEGYSSGSDSDSDVETTTTTVPVKPVPTKLTSTPKSAVSLPPPKQAKRPKKITIDLPKPNKGEDGEDDPGQPPTKKARTDGKGAGASSLLSMLPAPKQAVPAKPSQPERVLGGGNAPALSFNSVPRPASDEPDTSTFAKQNLFVPNSIVRGKANVSTEDFAAPRPRAGPSTPAVDFFSLGMMVAIRRQHYRVLNALFVQGNRRRNQRLNKTGLCRRHFQQFLRRQRSRGLRLQSPRHRMNTPAITAFHLESGPLMTRSIIRNSTRSGRPTMISMFAI
jgi:hypothetical protein